MKDLFIFAIQMIWEISKDWWPMIISMTITMGYIFTCHPSHSEALIYLLAAFFVAGLPLSVAVAGKA